jgi:hypothetical protein
MSVGEDNRNPINVINENGGRAVLPYPGLTRWNAYKWAKSRDDKELMAKFSEMAYKTANDILASKPATVGSGAAILNAKTLRETLVYPGAVIDGAEIIHNSTIMSDADEKTLIGAAAQIRDSIIGYGNSIDSAAQLKSVMTGECAEISKAARVTHSVIGACSRISCCEIANCLIGPFHSQHHNNSFLIAAYVGGQSNVAAGATIGSNHNSRSADGEIWANRGFWPGLCVSLKHNSQFASFTMIAKGSYPAELDVKLPFSLVAVDGETGETVIFPAYWFTHNMYATMRGAQKFAERDTRKHRREYIMHDILAPDTVSEMFRALRLIEFGEPLNMERGRPETAIKNAGNACKMYRMMIRHYCAKEIFRYMRDNGLKSFDAATVLNAANAANPFLYNLSDALQYLAGLERTDVNSLSDNALSSFLESVIDDCGTIAALTRESRAKDFSDPFRTMAYQSQEEADSVLGRLGDDPVIKRVEEEMKELSELAESFLPQS